MSDKILQNILLLLILPLYFSSCSTKYKVIKSHETVCDELCISNSKADIISVFGPPDRKTEDGLDGEILVYEKRMTRSQSANKTYYGQWALLNLPGSYEKSKTISKQIIREMAFYINDAGNCYRLRTEGYDFTERQKLKNGIDTSYPDFVMSNNIKINIGDKVLYFSGFSYKEAELIKIIKHESEYKTEYYFEVLLKNGDIKQTSSEFITLPKN